MTMTIDEELDSIFEYPAKVCKRQTCHLKAESSDFLLSLLSGCLCTAKGISDKILEAAKKHFETIDVNEINFMSVSHWLVDLGLGKYIKYRFFEKLAFRLRDDLWLLER